jgi:signal transduction histidine kinase
VGWLETRRIPVLFAVATLLPIAALCWLGLYTLDQDRDLESKRRRDRLEVAAGRVALEIEQDLQRIEASLADGHGIRFLSDRIDTPDDEALLFSPEVFVAGRSLSSDLLAAARQEYQNPAAAVESYRRIARTGEPADQGEALVALGGLFRRDRRFGEALRSYDALKALGTAPVAEGQPAELVARQGRARVFLESGDTAKLREEAIALGNALHRGGWLIDRASFEFYQHEMVDAWGGPSADPHAVQRASAVAELWRQWRDGGLVARGRHFVGIGSASTLAIWANAPAAPVVAVLTPEQLRTRWRHVWEEPGLTAALSRTDGESLFGAVSDGVTLSAGETRLPFILAVAARDDGPASDDILRRRIVIGGIVLAAALMVAASYGLYRITARELLLARQQSDFVAAVSHEFRTPLTSMRHLLDLLATRGVRDEDRKAEYYRLLSGETDRLQRMVETLLSFGRIDAAAHVWKLEPLDVGEMVDEVVREFRREIGERPLAIDVDAGLPSIRGDRDALERAIWNLLENAAKYSPGEAPIRLFARHEGTAVVIGVEDYGIGIPGSEQQRVFQKFVRGEEAKRAGIRGVGVGLALVKRIAEAHGGRVQLTSEVGAGSTFTLVLPAVNSQLPMSNSQSTVAAG